MPPVISIITPSYNQGEFIERTIQSVISQNIISLEHLIVDGGSTDNTLKVLRQYDNQISWISEKDDGQTDAINKGIIMTQGEIIGWLNSDDIYFADTVSSVIEYFEAHPHVDVVYGNAHHIGRNDEYIDNYPTEKWSYARLMDACFICQPALFFRRRCVKKCGMLDRKLEYCMDYEYWLRLGTGWFQNVY